MDITELYEFNVDGTYYYFTPKILKTTFNSKTFIPAIIDRGRIKITGKIVKDTVNISFIMTNSFARSLLVINPETSVTVIIYRNGVVYWQGIVLKAEGRGLYIELECSSFQSNNTRMYAQRRIQILCSNTLYDSSCKVVKEGFQVTASVASVDTAKTTITLTGLTQPDNYFLDGIFTFNQKSRRITKHTGNTIKLAYAFDDTPLGTVTLSPGCDLTEATCASKFNNRVNHMGFKRLPAITPYDSKGIL